jgi:hypothetical protein
MQVIGALRKFWRLPVHRRALLLEASATLAMVSAALPLLPFKRVIRLGSVPLREASEHTAKEVVSAIEMAGRRLPWRIVCIHKGLAAQRMLRRRGLDARLHYGIGSKPDRDGLAAHVWVSLHGVPVIGGEESHGFAPVGAFP